ncbi:MAG: CHAT domain-containing protein [Flavobacteriales bacterium]|nr:CHAT domain-containing protein [Flavobacteriales bacterium]
MQYSFKYIIILIVIYLIVINVKGQTSYIDIESSIFKGNLKGADSLINLQIQKDHEHLDKTVLFQLKGDILKLSGDIDGAHEWWLKSNEQRNKIYSKYDYHLAWNYALLANYYYEKINSPLAKVYADSCLTLIQDLNIEQQKEIKIYKIWNVLAQSYKQQFPDNAEKINLYEKVIRPYYLKSIAFQEKYKTPKETLAKTYHLLANTYIDVFDMESSISDKKAYECYNTGMKYYDIAIYILQQEYGSKHPDIALSYFVRAFFYKTVNQNKISNAIELAEKDYEKALYAYGLNSKHYTINQLTLLANKEAVLMCLKYYTATLINQFNRTKDNNYLLKSESINKMATQLWAILYKEFQSKNTNQNLAIYNLIPFEETISIELLKKEAKLDWSLDTIFRVNCKLKYYDIIKNNSLSLNDNYSLKKLQQKLKPDELYLEFLIDNIHLIFVTQDSVWVKEISRIGKDIKSFKKAIIEQNYHNYTNSATKIYQVLFSNLKLKEYNRMIVCPTGIFTNVPFEALMVSKQNIELQDYRKLDYLIHHIETEYCLSSLMFRNTLSTEKLEFTITAFAPYNPNLNLSQLPFSEKLVKELGQQKNTKSYIKEEATTLHFLTSKSSIIHVSSHGLIDQEYSSNSGLVFSDTVLYPEKITNSKLNSQLVVLNTCNSALGKYYVGDGIDGFVRIFHALGVTNTLSNIWEVDDKQSNQLLADFYNILEQGNSTIEALHEAKINTMNNAPNSKLAAPYYWAGHQLIGEDVVFEVENEKEDKVVLYWLLLLFAFVTGIWFFLRNKKHS